MKHGHVQLPAGDLLIHCGDATMRGTADELDSFTDWFAALDYPEKIFVPGNHDFCFQQSSPDAVAACQRLKQVARVLLDETCQIGRLKIHGTPWTPPIPRRRPMAFQQHALAAHFASIPLGLDILISHGPPKHHLDRILLGYHVGCPELKQAVARAKPRFHFFGHIHESFGSETDGETVFANASISNLLYNPTHPVAVFDV
jgi:Icc-related predicted phosphoesterase